MADPSTVTERRRAANRANAQQSTGPRTEAGKEQSKMNALKNGRYAERPDPAELVLASFGEEEQAEREQMRQECLRRYQPADEFAAAETEALAGLEFELKRLERVKQVMWQRERKLVEIEQKKRRRALYHGRIEGTDREVTQAGLAGTPDNFEKFCEMAECLGRALGRLQAGKFEEAGKWLRRVFGWGGSWWRGERILTLVETCQNAETDAQRGWACRKLETEIQAEVESVEQTREIWIDEHLELDAVDQAARLLEISASRSWAWVRREENSLRRAIDRKVRILLELREQHFKQKSEARSQESEGSPEPTRNPRLSRPPQCSVAAPVKGSESRGNSQSAEDPEPEAECQPLPADSEASQEVESDPASPRPPHEENSSKLGNEPNKSLEINPGTEPGQGPIGKGREPRGNSQGPRE